MADLSLSHDVEIIVYNYKYNGPIGDKWNLEESQALEVEDPKGLRLKEAIQTVTVQKGSSEPYGNFNITLLPTRNWMKIIKTSSWCAIYMKSSPLTEMDFEIENGATIQDGNCSLKMLGIITSIRSRVSIGENGTQEVRYDVSGFDFGYLLTTSIVLNQLFSAFEKSDQASIQTQLSLKVDHGKGYLSPDANVENLFGIITDLKSKTITQEIKEKIERCPTFNPELPTPILQYFKKSDQDGKTFLLALARYMGLDGRTKSDKDLAKITKNPLLGGKIIMASSLYSSPTIWEVIHEYANPILNQCLVDLMVYDGKVVPAFLLRQKPFNTKYFEKIVNSKDVYGKPYDKAKQFPITRYDTFMRNQITSDHIIGADIGTSELERLTYIAINGRLGMADGNVGKAITSIINPQVLDIAGVKRLGMRAYIRGDVDYSYSNTDTNSLTINYDFLEWSAIIADWGFFAHRYGNGTIQLIGLDTHIAIGENLEITDWNLFGHIEGYSHTVQVAPNGTKIFRSSVMLSRIMETGNGTPRFLGDEIDDEGTAFDRHVYDRTSFEAL